ncbi:MAG: DUF2971 domain-containing protein, partial [Flavobacterium sp.]|uniref:DUF2971 domain-containing protein n=1 Tax=Flavobacterium sp. TaxID=239 RepID=UPI0032669C74
PGVSEHIITGHYTGPGKFEASIGNNFALGTLYDPEATRFVHFTSLPILHSIINENAIRMYSMMNLNDPNEYVYFDELLKDVKIPKSDIYILSLCGVDALDSKNTLNLWRLYGQEGLGVAIEFEIEFHGYESHGGYYLGKVIYEKPNLEEFRVKNAEFERRNNLDKTDLRELMRVPACFHKNPYYEIEKEIRLMFFKKGSTIIATNFP